MIPNGNDIQVTENNKQEYVQRITELKLTHSIARQTKHFLKGLYEVVQSLIQFIFNFLNQLQVPSQALSIFNEYELELLISGLPRIDLADWNNNTMYRLFTEDSQEIKWFWSILKTFDDEGEIFLTQFLVSTHRLFTDLALLLQFSTGSSRVPLGGFTALKGLEGPCKFTIAKVAADKSQLPTASTWYIYIYIYVYM